MAKYIIEIEDVPSMLEDGFAFYNFAVLDAMQLKTLIKRWVSEQNETN